MVAFSGRLLYASDDSVTRRSLRGVKAFDVVIEAKDDNALGLTREGLQTDVELRCRQAGIKLEKVTEPFLYVAVTAQELTSAPSGRSMNAFALFVEVRFEQAVLLSRSPDTLVAAPTWSVGEMVTGPTRDSQRSCRGVVRDWLKSS